MDKTQIGSAPSQARRHPRMRTHAAGRRPASIGDAGKGCCSRFTKMQGTCQARAVLADRHLRWEGLTVWARLSRFISCDEVFPPGRAGSDGMRTIAKIVRAPGCVPAHKAPGRLAVHLHRERSRLAGPPSRRKAHDGSSPVTAARLRPDCTAFLVAMVCDSGAPRGHGDPSRPACACAKSGPGKTSGKPQSHADATAPCQDRTPPMEHGPLP